ncbi:MAG: hypothetical protein OHK0046_36990 [Anaerolineae bacterium]
MSSESQRPNITIQGSVNAANFNTGEQPFYGPVSFSFGAMPAAGNDVRAELQSLYQQLADTLAQVPSEQKQSADAVKTLAETALTEANKPEPNKTVLTVTGEGLKQAAQNLLAVAPIAAQIAAKLLMIG